MMNIFIMILVAILTMGYYWLSSPSSRVQAFETDTAIEISDMRGIAECALAVHNAKIKGTEFDDMCVTQADIKSEFICLGTNLGITPCEIKNKRKPAYSFIITTTAPLAPDRYNNMMEILEKYYADAGTFGLFQDNAIVSGGTTTKRTVPKAIVSKMEITDGQLVYMTQYEIPDVETTYSEPTVVDINCPAGTAKTYRFGRWQCVGINTKTDCAGDMIWNSEISECVPDESRKPLCAETQTAVMNEDELWECVDPFSDITCPNNMIARLNYSTLEWECVDDPNQTIDKKKCAHVVQNAIFGRPGATLRVGSVACTECEKLLIYEETCTAVCVPDPTKIQTNSACYPGNIMECTGPSRAMYFGFPDTASAAQAAAMLDLKITPTFDADHVQNRKFNCMVCPGGFIDASKSQPPYTATCK